MKAHDIPAEVEHQLVPIWCPQCHFEYFRVLPDGIKTALKLACGVCNRWLEVRQ